MSTAGMLQPVVVIKSAATDEPSVAVEYRELRGDELKNFLERVKW